MTLKDEKVTEKYCRQLQKISEEIDYSCKIEDLTSVVRVEAYTKSANEVLG